MGHESGLQHTRGKPKRGKERRERKSKNEVTSLIEKQDNVTDDDNYESDLPSAEEIPDRKNNRRVNWDTGYESGSQCSRGQPKRGKEGKERNSKKEIASLIGEQDSVTDDDDYESDLLSIEDTPDKKNNLRKNWDEDYESGS